MSWLILIIAGLFEIGWAVGMKFTEGFSKLVPSIITLVFMFISMALLSYTLKTIPVGTAYAVWTGIGAAGTAIIGMLWLGEPVQAARMVCILLIVSGIVGLKLFN